MWQAGSLHSWSFSLPTSSRDVAEVLEMFPALSCLRLPSPWADVSGGVYFLCDSDAFRLCFYSFVTYALIIFCFR